ncbi:MAG: lysophospholipid acyltransferase family protein, partial [bacterium]
VEHAFGLDGIESLARKVEEGDPSIPVMQRILAVTGLEPRVHGDELRRIPATGSTLVACNHPLGGADSIALLALLSNRRPDVRVLANGVLSCFPFASEYLFLVDPFGGHSAARRNAVAIRQAIEWLRAGHLLLVFPAGEVSSVHWGHWTPSDPPWSTIPARIARDSGAQIVPAWGDGANRSLFHAAGLLHPRLRTALLPNEFLAHLGTHVDFRFGHAIRPSESAGLDTEALTRLMRGRSELLRGALVREAAESAAQSAPPMEPIGEPESTPAEFASEFAAVPASDLLFEEGGYRVYATSAARIPRAMREIGRLREIAFRAVGEGSGKAIDIDRFDETYTQIVVWNDAAQQIVGGYRAGPVAELTRGSDVSALYTSTLFEYSPRIVGELGDAIELGRSFVRVECQRQPLPLSLLWKGIGVFMYTRGYRRMFGPVSISNDYDSMSKELIMEFLERHRLAKPFAPLVKPRHPPERRRIGAWTEEEVAVATAGLAQVDRLVDEIERGKRAIPVLLRQYLRLNASLLAFNVDSDFGDVVDALMMVDITQIDDRIVRHYIGDDGPAMLRARFPVSTER